MAHPINQHEECSIPTSFSFETLSESTFSEYDNSTDRNVSWPLRIVARFPRISLLVTLILQLSVWIVTISLVLTGRDVAPIKFDALPIQIRDGIFYQRSLAATSARLSYGLKKLTNEQWHTPKSMDWVSRVRIELLYTSDDDNILTEEKLMAIKSFEEKLTAHKELHELFHHISVFQMIPSNAVLDNRAAAIMIAMVKANATLKKFLPMLLPRNYTLNEKFKYAVSPMLRSLLIPLSWQKYDSKAFQQFRDGPLRSILRDHGDKGSLGSNVKFAYWGLELYQLQISDQGKRDALLAIGSFIFILVVILLHTGSTAVTSAGLFGILTALLSSNLIYRYVIGHRYIGVFHAISIFLLLGIGADDVFVLFDTWCDSFRFEHASESHRLSWVIRRAGAATLITSLTSGLAFLVNAGCTIPLISTFGIFTGIAVLVNYLIAITFLPCVFINIDNTCRSSRSRCCRPRWTEKTIRRMAKFFDNIFFPFISKRTVCVVSIVICVCLSGIFIWQVTLLAPSLSIVTQMFLRGTNFDRAEHMTMSMTQSKPIEVIVAFGIGLHNQSACTRDDFDCYGTPTWLKDFDMSSAKAQVALLDFCRRLRRNRDWRKPLNLAPHPLNASENYVRCFVDDMDLDMALPKFQKCPNDPVGAPLDLRVPVDRKKIERLMACYPHLLTNKATRLSPNFSRTFEAAVSWWLRDSNSMRADYATDNIMMTYAGGAPELRSLGGRLRLAIISVYTHLTLNSNSFMTGIPIRDNWETIIDKELKTMPTSALRSAFQCTQASSTQSPLTLWEWYAIQEAFWTNARIGLLVGLFGVSLPVLFIATRNILLTLAGTVCLSFTIGAVITMTVWLGWPLGVSESTNLALVTGLSVDYIVHFIEAYHQAGHEHHDRQERVRQMLTRVGGAVSSGVITTLGAISFLFGSKLLIFIQFGVFLGSAIFFAFFSALFLLTPFLLLFGPEGHFASLDPLLKKAVIRMRRLRA